MDFEIIAKVKNSFKEPAPLDEIRKEKSEIIIKDEFEAGLEKIEKREYLQIIYYFDRSDSYELVAKRHNGNKRGVFSSRSPHRPAGIGVTTVKLLERNANVLVVKGLDAINDTPVLDIKPYSADLIEKDFFEENEDEKGYEDLGFAKIDHDREKRKGFPEVVLCEGKTTEQVVEIMKSLAKKSDNILASRAEKEVFEEVKKVLPKARYNKLAKMIVREKKPLNKVGNILVVSAGTSDQPVVEEAIETAKIMGNKVTRLVDAGVAGVHRLLNNVDKLEKAKVIIVVAGMDGALPSVVAGLVNKPVIATPTSVGYGANLGGIAPLLTMLNSCATGVGVVNIDNGFGAAYLANSINKIGEERGD